MSSEILKRDPLVAVVMGSDSDLSTLQPAANLLKDFEIPYEERILSAHRTPIEMVNFAKNAIDRSLKVIIAGAGGAAHLPGMLASLTSIPVIGVPVRSQSLSGIDSLYSIVQMPAGVPVATVAIGGGLNAGLLAAQILSVTDKDLHEKICIYRESLRQNIKSKDQRLLDLGSSTYLSKM